MNPTEAEATRTTPLKTEVGEAYPPKNEANEKFPAKSEVTETSPLTNDRRQSTSMQQVHAAGRTFGATPTIISLLIAFIIPISEVTIGSIYKGDCPIDQRIATYMIVAGSVDLALVVVLLLLALTSRRLFSDSPELAMGACCGVCCMCIIAFFLVLFRCAWHIVGCVWIFGVSDHVQFTVPTKPNFCEPVLYHAAFVLLIITPIYVALNRCVLLCIHKSSARAAA